MACVNLDALMFTALIRKRPIASSGSGQADGLVLITANRNREGRDSLEETIRELSQSDSLPVLTIADDQRYLIDPGYRERVADQCLEYLYDINNLLGTGRLFLP